MPDAKPNIEPHAHSVVFYAYPKLVFAWPVILLGLLFWLLTLTIDPKGDHNGYLEFYGWFYLLTSVMVILTISVDVERNYAFVWAILFLVFLFGGMWLSSVSGFTLFGNLYNFFANMDLQYDRGFGLATSIFLGVPYLVMLVWVRINHKWRITHNEFEHFSWGRSDDSLARGAKRFRSTYPDLLEFILGLGAGTLIVYSATGRTELRRIHNVPMLPLLRKRIDKILEYTAVTTDSAHSARGADLLESEEEEDEPGADDLGGSGGSESRADDDEGGDTAHGIGDEKL